MEVHCGYEAGCTGYGLQRFLEGNAIDCAILAPSTMLNTSVHNKKKTDAIDAVTIAKNLAFGSYSPVHIPTPEDEAVRDYIRMRNDHQEALKKVKQQIDSFCLRLGEVFTGTKSNWTIAHVKWLRELSLSPVNRETLDEYLLEYDRLTEKVNRLDKRISVFAETDDYREQVGLLTCFMGIKNRQALSLIVETSDFARFRNANDYAAWLGLLPGIDASGQSSTPLGITKAGNRHLRKTLIETSGCFQRGKPGYKSVELKKRQKDQPPECVAYADRANERLRRKCQKMLFLGKPRNVAGLRTGTRMLHLGHDDGAHSVRWVIQTFQRPTVGRCPTRGVAPHPKV